MLPSISPPSIFSKEWFDSFWDLSLFHCLDRITQGQLSKCNLRNTVIVSRTKVALAKTYSKKFHKFFMKKALMKSSLSQVVGYGLTEKEIHHFLTALKFFQNSYSRSPVQHWWTAVPKLASKNEKGHVVLIKIED